MGVGVSVRTGTGAGAGQGPGPLLTQLAVADAHVTLQQIVHLPGSFFLRGAGLGARGPGGECQAAQGHPRAQGCFSPSLPQCEEPQARGRGLGVGLTPSSSTAGPCVRSRSVSFPLATLPSPGDLLVRVRCPIMSAPQGGGVRVQAGPGIPSPSLPSARPSPSPQGHCRVSRAGTGVVCQGHPGVQGGDAPGYGVLRTTHTEQGGCPRGARAGVGTPPCVP